MSSNIVEIINSLIDLLPLKPASDTQITEAEIQLRLNFADEYKVYLKTFGAIMANGIELTGIAKSQHRNVVSVTQEERTLNPKVPNSMYVVESTCVDGIVIWQDSEGYIYKTQPNLEPKKIADSLAEYVQNHNDLL